MYSGLGVAPCSSECYVTVRRGQRESQLDGWGGKKKEELCIKKFELVMKVSVKKLGLKI